ncbi:L-ectoine synthase [Peptococcaceae bacterium SCADC1_2_3]|jgi:L-ectoine synthase|nr:L-ectoine synthase [Peptococcaceae bacterium SCADC1_2_3]KFI36129.1 L-ectoine synthase [Peptococcaceae bacterium SCADC1_2_3]
MIIKNLEEVIGTENDVGAENWQSRRLLLKKDGMGFSFHDTIIWAGTETLIWYKHHVEAVYCIEGEGEIELTGEDIVYPLKPGTMYALNGHEKHYLRAKSNMRLVCVFNPPCTGKETHDKDGSYHLPVEEPEKT